MLIKEQTIKAVVRRAHHSIQNPAWNLLNSIVWMRYEISSTDLTEELNSMEQNVERIRGIAEDFSRFLKPLSQRMESFDLLEIINSVIFRNQTKDRDIQKSFPDTVVNIKGDKADIEWVIEELIQNAFKYDAMYISISVTLSSELATILFKDNGSGIKVENIENLFVPFKVASGQGTGLGLANAKRIINAHRGELLYIGPNDKPPKNPVQSLR
ncbi:HAMP domain-containing sensor histidine kinase [Desulfococcaceae bacterium HSG9]|nr:HAMP domain-containing sensor histidine kinase [Desulfococcaceae bacterium HSG9]